ncbi:HK97 gp10 family phage protein [Blautia luti]|uniref:HK97 gp10 family phage protein n=1 Tax=Blautia luti TaxID=89014 RepID=UPI001D013869|nr:HK97 gp10 family phage protein [Blautia luti]MCB5474279.1 HK97 gp10 family phage protein [Blautia luti]
MGSSVKIDEMANEIMKGLTEYADLATDEMKSAVKKAGKTVKDEIKVNAPKKTGKYASSWRTKTTLETANSLHLTVYSPKKYQLAHLLENGHAKRGGGRTAARSHIAPAEEAGIEKLESEIERALR